MKIGVFGDSYADVVYDMRDSCWPKIVADSLVAKADFHAQSGTSMWTAYELFKRHYKQYDVIIFSFTTPSRWPALPKELRGREFNIGYSKNDEFLNKINPFFFSIFPEELLDFICSNIHRNVVELCERENKYLIQVVPFIVPRGKQKSKFDFDFIPNKFPLVTGLDYVSKLEEVFYLGKRVKTGQAISDSNGYEHRACHLNPGNNKIIADWITDCIRAKSYNVNFDCEKYNKWVVFDQSDSDLFNITRRTK